MLSGSPAFAGDDISVLLHSIGHAYKPSFSMLPDVPANVVAALNKAFEKDPAARFADVTDFARALADPSFGEAKATRPLRTPDPAAPDVSIAAPIPAAPPRSRARRAALAAVALLAVAWWALPHAEVPDTPPRPPRIEPTAAASTPTSAPVTVASPIEATAATTMKRPDKPLPQAALDDLDAADRALTDGRLAEAIHLARHSLLFAPSSRAYATLSLAYCAKKDFSNATASFEHVQSADKRRVIAGCQRFGIELE
jgi:hypothetical protein